VGCFWFVGEVDPCCGLQFNVACLRSAQRQFAAPRPFELCLYLKRAVFHRPLGQCTRGAQQDWFFFVFSSEIRQMAGKEAWYGARNSNPASVPCHYAPVGPWRWFLAWRRSQKGQFLKVREWTSQLYFLIEHVLGVPWLVYIRPKAPNNPPNRHSKLEVRTKFLWFYAHCQKVPGHGSSSELFRRKDLRPDIKSMGQMATEKWSQISLETSGTLLKVNT
jgi:hypothetical protein